MEPAPATHYGPLDKKNPVLSAFQSELKEFKSHIKKLSSCPSGDYRPYSRGSIKLNEIWNKYKPRLPQSYFEEHLLQLSDFLLDSKFYRLALWQGYRLYLQQFCTVSLESIQDLELFKLYFSRGFESKRAKLTFRALQGECLCIFYLEREISGPLDERGVENLLSILGFLRILMEAVLPDEALCWILYNVQAEVFARRALDKINELAKLEETTGSEISLETQQAYKEATIKKLAIMVFKRSVYEHRRKPKGLFRPKQKSKLKELQPQTPWPRTQTEHILMEMFEGNAARFLAVLEALHDSSVRPLQTGLPEEFEVQEVVLELISAGTSLLAGNYWLLSSIEKVGYIKSKALPMSHWTEHRSEYKCYVNLYQSQVVQDNDFPLKGFGDSEHTFDETMPNSLNAVSHISALFEEAVAGHSKIALDAAVKFVKQLFRFEQWSTFRSLSAALMLALADMEGRQIRRFESELRLMESVERLMSTQRVKFISKDWACDDKNPGPAVMTEEFISLIQTLHACVCLNDEDIQPDADLVLDLVLFFWTKCKAVFQLWQMKHPYAVRYPGRMPNHDQWVETLLLLCEVVHAHPLADTDYIVVSEMTLRLATVLESSADSLAQSGRKTSTIDDSEESISVRKSSSSLFLKFIGNKTPTISRDQQRNYGSGADFTALAMDLHLELLVFQHRLSLKLSVSWPGNENEEEIKLKASVLFRRDQTCTEETKKLLEDSVSLMGKAELEERKLVSCTLNSGSSSGLGEERQPPPAPMLLTRSYGSMTFKPAPYALDEEVSWYSIYGREAEGVNLKVRLKDCCLHGTADMIPAKGECLLHVGDLEPDKLYVFAVAAFDAQGKMLGKAIGKSTRPLLCPDALRLSSPVLQQLFISSIFIQTDICIRENNLFCDSLCDAGPLIWSQNARLAECDRMLLVVDLALHLNDDVSCLQAIVSCYGLLAPIIFHQISAEPVREVLLKCFAVLQEIPEVLKQKRLTATTESLQHMVACITHYLVKTHQENQKALSVLEIGKKMLQEISDLSLKPPKKSLEQEGTKTAPCLIEESSEQLKSLGAIIMKNMPTDPANCDVTSCLKIGPNGYELSGLEDLGLIYLVIESSPLQQAFKEVMKLKQKPCFLEFVVHLFHKALRDNELDAVLEWEQYILSLLRRHDEALLGLKKHPSTKGQPDEESGAESNTKSVPGGS
ncbi:hypothetical protein DNTS_001486 [Danionella cerebrum]|uniref:Uncharacterized protein n=1 Tax=Danionella cerebrum TaxID=2873325 RepID=A0A553N504_9TELE|nr:hypothetical protein DNTS_001486 [Danionella translucida]